MGLTASLVSNIWKFKSPHLVQWNSTSSHIWWKYSHPNQKKKVGGVQVNFLITILYWSWFLLLTQVHLCFPILAPEGKKKNRIATKNPYQTCKMISTTWETNFMADYDFKALLFRSLGVNNLLTTGSRARTSERSAFHLQITNHTACS